MRRRLTIIALWLVAGAIVNVAVAWGIVLYGEQSSVMSSVDRASSSDVSVLQQSRFVRNGNGAELADAVHKQEQFTPGREAIWYSHPLSEPGAEMTLGDVFAVRIKSGWPLRSLEGLTGSIPQPKDRIWQTRQVWAWRVNPKDVQTWPEDVIPLRPVWPGFAINTFFYAAILWMIFTLPFWLRRYFRRKRGLCPACAYPIGTSTVCTECGAAIMLRRNAV